MTDVEWSQRRRQNFLWTWWITKKLDVQSGHWAPTWTLITCERISGAENVLLIWPMTCYQNWRFSEPVLHNGHRNLQQITPYTRLGKNLSKFSNLIGFQPVHSPLLNPVLRTRVGLPIFLKPVCVSLIYLNPSTRFNITGCNSNIYH